MPRWRWWQGLQSRSRRKTKRNVIDRSRNCEVDVIVANCQDGWMTQYPKHFFVECKNWDKPVDSKVLRDVAMKMEDRYVEVGVLVTANGITGNPTDLTAAHQEIVIQQAKGRRIVVVTLDQIRLVATTEVRAAAARMPHGDRRTHAPIGPP